MFKNNSSFLYFYIFIFGFLCGVKVNLLGQIYIGEIFAILFFPFYLIFRRVSRIELGIFLSCLLWSICQIISDIINNTIFIDSLKGVLTPLVFFAVILVFFNILKKDVKKIAYFLLGVSFVSIAQMLIYPTDYQIANMWKFGLGLMTLNIILIYFSFFNKKRKVILLVCILVFLIISLLNDYRSMAFFPLAGYIVYIYFGRYSLNKKFAKFSVFKLIVPLFVLFLLINSIAANLFESGYLNGFLPQEVDQKFRAQATSNVGLILAGRSESLISLRAFWDSPWYGHGSWAKDARYIDEYTYLKYIYGVSDSLKNEDQELIPTHSYIMGSAVWLGFMGILIWLFLTNMILKNYFINFKILPIYFHVGIILFLWNLLFSPFGADARWNTGLFFASFFAYIWCKRSKIVSMRTSWSDI